MKPPTVPAKPLLLAAHDDVLGLHQRVFAPEVGPLAWDIRGIEALGNESFVTFRGHALERPLWGQALGRQLGGREGRHHSDLELIGHREFGEPAQPEENVFNEFDLEMPTRTAYDLDVPRGQRPQGRALGSESGLDLYRTSSGVNNGGQISGVSTTNDNSKNFNAIHQINPDDPPEACRRLPVQGGGNIALRDLRQGAKVCLRTHDHRWTVFTVTRMPSHAEDLLVVHVTVL